MSHEEVLNDAPLTHTWQMLRSHDRTSRNVWECTARRFEWDYTSDETGVIVSGEVRRTAFIAQAMWPFSSRPPVIWRVPDLLNDNRSGSAGVENLVGTERKKHFRPPRSRSFGPGLHCYARQNAKHRILQDRARRRDLQNLVGEADKKSGRKATLTFPIHAAGPSREGWAFFRSRSHDGRSWGRRRVQPPIRPRAGISWLCPRDSYQ